MARFLAWLGENTITGPINAASPTPLTMKEIVGHIEKATQKKAIIFSTGDDADHTPFSDGDSRFLQVTKAEALGFTFQSFESWLPGLIQHYVKLKTG